MKKRLGFWLMVISLLSINLMLTGCNFLAPDFEIDVKVAIIVQNNFSQPVTLFRVKDLNDSHINDTLGIVFESGGDEFVDSDATREINVRLYKNNKTDNWDCQIRIYVRSYSPLIGGEFILSGSKKTIKVFIDDSGNISFE